MLFRSKQDNCQVAVSVSVASEQASLPVAWQLYLPREWALDKARRAKAGVPSEVGFATKGEIALGHLERLLSQGAPLSPLGIIRPLRFRHKQASAGEAFSA